MVLRRIITLLLLLAVSLPGLVTAEEEYWEYTFRPGDSIWKIAEEYTTSVNNWLEIQELNKIRQGPDRRIPPGTRIVIPVSMLWHYRFTKRKQVITPIQTVNNVLKWSFMVSGMAGLLLVGSIFATWLLIEMLAVLVGITAWQMRWCAADFYRRCQSAPGK